MVGGGVGHGGGDVRRAIDHCDVVTACIGRINLVGQGVNGQSRGDGARRHSRDGCIRAPIKHRDGVGSGAAGHIDPVGQRINCQGARRGISPPGGYGRGGVRRPVNYRQGEVSVGRINLVGHIWQLI